MTLLIPLLLSATAATNLPSPLVGTWTVREVRCTRPASPIPEGIRNWIEAVAAGTMIDSYTIRTEAGGKFSGTATNVWTQPSIHPGRPALTCIGEAQLEGSLGADGSVEWRFGPYRWSQPGGDELEKITCSGSSEPTEERYASRVDSEGQWVLYLERVEGCGEMEFVLKR